MITMTAEASDEYSDLIQLFQEWRTFEQPPRLDGAPDYTADQFEKRYTEFQNFRARLIAISPGNWPVEQQVDWYLVSAEMNGFDFNHRVLKPWVRDPAFYQSVWLERSDVPGHEGPTHHAVTEFWTYELPLTEESEQRLIADINVIPPLMAQAKVNLTGNARDLWIAGIRNIRDQNDNLDAIKEAVGSGSSSELDEAIENAKAATDNLVAWLEEKAGDKNGPSGIGKGNYTWYQQNVHMVPLTWEDEDDDWAEKPSIHIVTREELAALIDQHDVILNF